jgi:uncharacterized protein (TIGR03032 family)
MGENDTKGADAWQDMGQKDTSELKKKPELSFDASRLFPSWLASTGGSLAFTTYQANKLFLIGTRPEDGKISIFERTFPRCMGLGIAPNGLWMSSVHTLWNLTNFLEPGQNYQGYDAVYVPLKGHTTGDIDIHDVHLRKDGTPLFVATRFNCLATVSPTDSFQPVWKPPFIDRIASEDRCHLNGLAMEDGEAAYVTVVATTNVQAGWREHRRDGGQLIDVKTGEAIVTGLSMPHSPRVRDGKIWMIQSGTGEFGYVDKDAGKFVPTTFLQGFARGLSFSGDHALIGVSRPRKDRTFEGLELSERLTKEGVSSKSMIAIVNLNTGDVEHTLEIHGVVQELYDVAHISGIKRPQALGFKTDDIRFMIRPGQLPD